MYVLFKLDCLAWYDRQLIIVLQGKLMYFFFFKILFIHLRYRERARAGGEAEGEGEAGFPLSQEPGVGLNPRTLGL